jgi:hypothetical protein
MTLGYATDSRITGHLAYQIQIKGDERGLRA